MEGGNAANEVSGITQFAEGEPNFASHLPPVESGSRASRTPKKFSRQVREVRKVLKISLLSLRLKSLLRAIARDPRRALAASQDLSGAKSLRREKTLEDVIPKRRSRKPPLDGACLGRQLDGAAVKKKARVPLTLPSRTPKCRIIYEEREAQLLTSHS